MILDQTVSVFILQPIQLLDFFIEVGPILFLSLTFSSFLFFIWYATIELNTQKKKQRLWFAKNEWLLRQHEDLRELLDGFGQRVSCCSNCNNDRMQLWDYRQNLLVVRCRSCKMNFTFAKEHNELIQPILCQLKRTAKLVNTLVKYKYYPLGKRLAEKLAIDFKSIGSEISPLAIIHFTSAKKMETKVISILDIDLNEWAVICPDKSELLVS